MKHSNSVFHQLLKHLPRHQFQKAVDRHKGDHRVRSLPCWTQLISLMFAQMTGRTSLRDLEENFNTKRNHHYHLGVERIKRSSLSDANNNRPSAIFMETFFYLLGKVRGELPRKVEEEMVRLIDSTTIDMNLNQFEWASFRSTKAGIKLHTVYDPDADIPTYFEMTAAKINDRKAAHKLPIIPGAIYVVDRAYNDYGWYYSLTQQGTSFVGRMKSNAIYEVIENRETTASHILEDQIIRLSSVKAQKDCPTDLRRVTIVREDDGKVLSFITNDLVRTAQEIADLYKSRWQIELFFRWIKQNLKIKRFLGQSENAVKIQVLSAMIVYLLLRLTQITTHCKLSLQQIARRVGLNLTSRCSLLELFTDPPEKNKVNLHHNQGSLELVYA
ncbi:IS4 family transposase [Endozoicomonas atrinae]|uniref:IS4 family transposase n=1 Tax=Endozoicomonas atrinae TaxID=1333660 RepID=UPI003B00CFC6